MKRTYMQPETSILEIQTEGPMAEWFSANVNTNEEIEDDDVGAKDGFFDNEEEGSNQVHVWE